MGNHCRSIRASVLDRLPIRHDSVCCVRLFLPGSFTVDLCHLAVAVVPALLLGSAAAAAALAGHAWIARACARLPSAPCD